MKDLVAGLVLVSIGVIAISSMFISSYVEAGNVKKAGDETESQEKSRLQRSSHKRWHLEE